MTTKSEALPVGALLLDPGEGSHPRPKIWTVTSAKTVIYEEDYATVKATLTKPGLPKGWRRINNGALAQKLMADDA